MAASKAFPATIYIDATRRNETPFASIDIEDLGDTRDHRLRFIPVSASSAISAGLKRHVLLPLLAILRPKSQFFFCALPPPPIFALIPNRTVFYVRDTFLLTRASDYEALTQAVTAPLFAFAIRHQKRLLAASEKTARDMAWYTRSRSIGLLRMPITPIGHAIETQPRPAHAPLRIAMIGPIEPRKDFETALRVLRTIHRTFDHAAELHVIGRATDETQAHPQVTFYSDINSGGVRRLFEQSDICLSTSFDEGEAGALLAAQAQGLAVVAPDKPIFREVLGSSAIFYEHHLPASAAAAIDKVISENGWRQRRAALAVANVRRWNALAESDKVAALNEFSRTEAATDLSTRTPAGA